MKSFKEHVSEMTMSAGIFNMPLPDLTDAEYIGDIEIYRVICKKIGEETAYGLTLDDNVPLCFLTTRSKNVFSKDYEEIIQIQTKPEYRGKNLAKNLLFFIKSFLKKSLLLGDIQSRDGQAFSKSIAQTGRFPMFWLNAKTGEMYPYEHEKDNFTIKPYRSVSEPTGWQIMIESLETPLQSVPRYFSKDIWKRRYTWFD